MNKLYFYLKFMVALKVGGVEIFGGTRYPSLCFLLGKHLAAFITRLAPNRRFLRKSLSGLV